MSARVQSARVRTNEPGTVDRNEERVRRLEGDSGGRLLPRRRKFVGGQSHPPPDGAGPTGSSRESHRGAGRFVPAPPTEANVLLVAVTHGEGEWNGSREVDRPRRGSRQDRGGHSCLQAAPTVAAAAPLALVASSLNCPLRRLPACCSELSLRGGTVRRLCRRTEASCEVFSATALATASMGQSLSSPELSHNSTEGPRHLVHRGCRITAPTVFIPG